MALTDDEIIIVAVVGTLAGVTIIALILRLLVPRCRPKKDESALIYNDNNNRQQRSRHSSNTSYRSQQQVLSRDRYHDNLAYASDRRDGPELGLIRSKDYSLGAYPVRNGRVTSGGQLERMYSSDIGIHGDIRRIPNAAELRAVGYGPRSVDRFPVRPLPLRRSSEHRDDIFHPVAGNISNQLHLAPQHYRPFGRNSIDMIPRPVEPPPVSPKLKPFNISSRYRENWDNEFDPHGHQPRSQ